MDETSYDVRFRRTRVYKGKKVTTYTVRWTVGGEEFTEPFRLSSQAESFRSDLMSSARKGEAFSTETGRPVSWQRAASEMTWYEFACKFTDMKWKSSSAIYRRDIARALTAATPAMILEGKPGKPGRSDMRVALRRWAFNSKRREEAPEDVTATLTWLSKNTANVSALANLATARHMLDTATTTVGGKQAAASTARRNRTILGNALDYARELKAIESAGNPIRAVKWKAPKTSSAVDRRSVVNPAQARALLDAVGAQRPSGPRLKAFFAVIYFAAARPEEAVNIGEDDVTFPPIIRNKETGKWEIAPDSDGWGDLEFREATPDAGREWTDDGEHRERRQLKHRAVGETRPVPMHPELSLILWNLVHDIGTSPGGKLFTGVRGGELPTITARRSWTAARKTAFTPEQQKSPLARRIYDIRHAALSTWLNAGVAPTQVAEWAGHSVKVLLDIYAKCIDGQQEIAKRRIAEALRADDDGQGAEPGPG